MFRRCLLALIVVTALSADRARASFVTTPVPTAAAMFIACDGWLSGSRLVETDAVTCGSQLLIRDIEKLVLGAESVCWPYGVTPQMKAYAYVVEYLRRVRRDGETTFSGGPWFNVARTAWLGRWSCKHVR